MGSNSEGSKDNRSRGGGKGGEENEEEKRLLCFAYQPRRIVNQDFVFAAAAYGTKDDTEKEKEKRGIMIFISALIFFILARDVTTKVIESKKEKNESKREENENGKDPTSFSYFSSLCDELQLLIMSKVPVHSLVKFRHVSKTWRSWIHKEHFFFGKCPQLTDGFFFPRRNGFNYIPLPDNDIYDEEDLDGDSYTIFYPTPSLFPFPGDDSFKVFHHASNGLLLLSAYGDPLDELLVHNPLTRQTLLLPMASHKFSIPLWIGYEPRRSPYFYVIHAVSVPGSYSPVLQIFSSRSWTWHDLVIDVRPVHSPRRVSGRAVTYDGQMFVDLTFLFSVILVVDLRTGKDYVIVPSPPGLPQCLKDAWSVLGMCLGNIMYAYSQSGVLLVYKLMRLVQGDYRWTLVIEDTSLQDRLASKFGTAPTYHVEAEDFLLHVPVLLISSTCSVNQRCKVLSYNFTNGSVVELFESKSRIHSVTSLSICPLEICSGDSSL